MKGELLTPEADREFRKRWVQLSAPISGSWDTHEESYCNAAISASKSRFCVLLPKNEKVHKHNNKFE